MSKYLQVENTVLRDTARKKRCGVGGKLNIKSSAYIYSLNSRSFRKNSILKLKKGGKRNDNYKSRKQQNRKQE